MYQLQRISWAIFCPYANAMRSQNFDLQSWNILVIAIAPPLRSVRHLLKCFIVSPPCQIYTTFFIIVKNAAWFPNAVSLRNPRGTADTDSDADASSTTSCPRVILHRFANIEIDYQTAQLASFVPYFSRTYVIDVGFALTTVLNSSATIAEKPRLPIMIPCFRQTWYFFALVLNSFGSFFIVPFILPHGTNTFGSSLLGFLGHALDYTWVVFNASENVAFPFLFGSSGQV